MDAVFPFQDLNLIPPSSSSSSIIHQFTTTAAVNSATHDGISASTSTFPFKIPKIEPKSEPIDYSYDLNHHHSPQQQQVHQNPHLSNSTPNFHSNYQTTPPSQPSLHEQGGDNATAYNQDDGDIPALNSETGAIVLRDELSSPSAVGEDAVAFCRRRRRDLQRSRELVRVTEIGPDFRRFYRDSIRRTRMVYDALRIFTAVQAEKRHLQIGSTGDMDSVGEMSGSGGEMGPAPIRRRGGYVRGDLLAASLMRERGMWLNRDKRIVGSIPGIEVGDLFFFRVELCVLGLHGQMQAGIDYLPASQSSNGEPIATSIIVSGGYEDNEDAGDTIIYTGHGGQDKFSKSKQCVDQTLNGGNLALERSMHYGIEIRVIRGVKYETGPNKVYVYDGLYRIHECWFDVGKSGFGVYKYRLLRIEGQPEMGSTKLKFALSLRSSPLSVRPKGYVSFDISNGKENVAVFLFNDIDSSYDPLYFEYLTKPVFPPFLLGLVSPGAGCGCVSGCTDACLCATKNEGEFPYDQHGFLLRGKPIIFECGAFCRCPPDCRNRVSQKALKKRLEVYRSRETGWGVRTLDLIHAGEFICEYTGVVLTREQAELFTMNGDRLLYPSRFAKKWVEWGDLSQIYSDYVHPSSPSVPPLDFAMDVSRMRNVASYISHSSTPNVLVQFVLYDHNNLMFPHVMLFAMENIPPLGDVTLDYGITEADGSDRKLAICN